LPNFFPGAGSLPFPIAAPLELALSPSALQSAITPSVAPERLMMAGQETRPVGNDEVTTWMALDKASALPDQPTPIRLKYGQDLFSPVMAT
jgi:hypothetical protein